MVRRLTRLRPVPGAGAPHLSAHSFPPAPAAPNRNSFWPTPASVGLTSCVFLMSHQCAPRRRPMAAAPGSCACSLGSHPGSRLPSGLSPPRPRRVGPRGEARPGDSRGEAGAGRSGAGPARPGSQLRPPGGLQLGALPAPSPQREWLPWGCDAVVGRLGAGTHAL